METLLITFVVVGLIVGCALLFVRWYWSKMGFHGYGPWLHDNFNKNGE